MTLRVKRFDDLDEVAREAGDALSREKQKSLFDRLDWLTLVAEHWPPSGRLLALQAKSGAASAWLFLAMDRGSATAFANPYCLRFGQVTTSGSRAEAAGLLARSLRKAGVRRLSLSPLAHDDALGAALRRNGWIVRVSPTSVNWRMPVTGMSFEEYWASRPSRLRNTVKRRARAAALEIRVHDCFDDQAWRDYQGVYQASWKPEEGSPAFMRALAEQEGAAGTLRLGLAYRNGQAVAAQFWLVENKVATIHKLAYREDAREHSPGSILSHEMFRRAIDVDRVGTIDFGTGDDSYKADWMSESLPLHTLTAFDMLSPGGLVSLGRSVLSKLVRRVRSD